MSGKDAGVLTFIRRAGLEPSLYTGLPVDRYYGSLQSVLELKGNFNE